MSEPQDAGKYQVNSDGTVQGQVIGDNPIVYQHFYGPQEKAPSSTKPQRVWNIPYLRNDYFTGREEILAELHARFKANNTTALSQRHAMSGLGGIGKTQTAVEYAYRYHEEYQAMLWARAESHEALTSSFVEIAALLDLPQKSEKDQTLTVKAVKHWLQANSKWLLILDNADEPVIVREFLPTKFDGHVLLTTRAQALGGLARCIAVGTFTPELGALFLLRRADPNRPLDSLEQVESKDRAIALQISQELGGLPLALDQAGAYIEATRCRLSDYQSQYQLLRTELLQKRGNLAFDHPASVVITFSSSFKKVARANPASIELLRLFAFFHPDAIPEEILTESVLHLGPILQSTVSRPGQLDLAIEELLKYSLVHRNAETKTLSIHRLVQAVLKDQMKESIQQRWAKRVVEAVSHIIQASEEKQEERDWLYVVQAQECALLVKQWEMISSDTLTLLMHTGSFLMEQFHHSEAEALFKQALEILYQDIPRPDFLTVVHSLSQLGMLYHREGKYREAEPLLLGASALCETAFGPDNLHLGTTYNNLALLYHNQGKYEQAEPLYQRALAIREKQLGPAHPDIAQSLNNLAGLYYNQSKYEQAEPLHQRALAIYEQQLGPDHPDTAQSLNNLALLYHGQSKYEQAEPLYQRALAIYEQQLGPDHPDTAQSLNNLAGLYHNQGKYEQAEPLYQRALAIDEQQLGPEHPYTASSLNNLAGLYDNQGKYEQAEPLYQRALAIREKQLGPQHPDTAQSLNNLAGLYRAQGKHEQAEPLYQHALVIDEKQLGPDHPNTAVRLNNLAGLYQAQGKFELAEPLFQQALAIWEKQLGPDHPSTASSLNNLAGLYQVQSKFELAEPLLQRALAIKEQQLGPDHPSTASSLNNLARLYQVQSKFELAEQLYQRALAIDEKALGSEHPYIATDLNSLAELYRDQDKYKQAEPLYVRALSIDEKALGPQHSNTKVVRQNYITLLRAMGRDEEAKQLEEGNEG